MGYFPGPILPISVHSYSQYSPYPDARSMGTGAAANVSSQAWPAANQATYIPMWLPWDYPAVRAFWANGSALGNCDIGLYTRNGTKIWSSGSTAQSGASSLQYVTCGIVIPAGMYYIGLANDGTTNRMSLSTGVTAIIGRQLGLLQQATAFPLPSSMTGAQWASTGYPLCGFTRLA